ncbi:hypothetical protein [Streptococcus orisratti]
MAETKTETVFVIKNQAGQFLSYQPYDGTRRWVNEYSDSCVFPNQFAATLYCRSLMADAEMHEQNFDFDVYQYNNTIKELNVTIADEARKQYGLPDKAAASNDNSDNEVTN